MINRNKINNSFGFYEDEINNNNINDVKKELTLYYDIFNVKIAELIEINKKLEKDLDNLKNELKNIKDYINLPWYKKINNISIKI